MRMKIVGIIAILTGVLAGIVLLWNVNTKKDENQVVRIGIAVYNNQDAFISGITSQLNGLIYEYEQNSPQIKINTDIADAKGSQQEQNMQIERYISLDYDMLFVNIVDRTNAAVIIDKVSEAGIPTVFFNREPVRQDIFRSENIFYEGSNAKDSALMQAEIVAEAYKADAMSIDRNGNGVIEYAMLEGEAGHQDTIIRSEWVLKGLADRNIRTEKIVSTVANWERSQAEMTVRQWMDSYRGRIELIISNNDDMALGAADALEFLGIKNIPIVGIDGMKDALHKIKEGKILGTVMCDTSLHAKALFDFMEAWVIDKSKIEQLPLLDERYYMIPLYTVTSDNIKDELMKIE